MKKICFLLNLVLCLPAISQEKAPIQSAGISLGMVVSANGYGPRYSSMAYYRKGRVVASAGILVQKQQGTISGIGFRMDYALTGFSTPEYEESKEYPKNLELFTFMEINSNKGAILSNYVLSHESKDQLAHEMPLKDYRFSSIEAYTGFGLKWRLFKRIKWVNSIGLGGYYTLNYPGSLYYNRSCAGLICKTEISVRLRP